MIITNLTCILFDVKIFAIILFIWIQKVFYKSILLLQSILLERIGFMYNDIIALIIIYLFTEEKNYLQINQTKVANQLKQIKKKTNTNMNQKRKNKDEL